MLMSTLWNCNCHWKKKRKKWTRRRRRTTALTSQSKPTLKETEENRRKKTMKMKNRAIDLGSKVTWTLWLSPTWTLPDSNLTSNSSDSSTSTKLWLPKSTGQEKR